MAPPNQVIWAADEHTFAKHRLLRRYLDAWLPIMARYNPRLVLIDGFAGPGRYLGGQPGSPLVMLDAYLSHGHRGLPHLARVELVYVFIEQDSRRVTALANEIEAIALPANVRVSVIEGSFDIELPKLLDAMPPGQSLSPTFAFIDPFGYTDHDLQLSSRILGFKRCEVLVYMPFPFIARFVDQASIAPALTRLYGDESWQAAQGKATLAEREAALHDAFLVALRRSAKRARSFEIVGKGGNTGYHLFFATGDLRGLERMKDAMWKVDPVAGSTFADSTNPGQLVLFADRPDLARLDRDVRKHFGSHEFSIEDARAFTIEVTPFLPKHVNEVLRAIEVAGHLTARHLGKPRRRNTYPDGTLITLKP